MQEVSEVKEAWSLEDDMLDGDLGDGMGVSETPSSTRKRSQRFAGVSESLLVRAELVMRSSEAGEAAWIPALKTAERARWKLPLSAGSLDDLSKEELRERLQEATEVIDVLCCDLDVTNRYLEGKFEALKILQGKAMLDKATSHTKSMLQKSEDKAKALEKEVNSLQWELSFHQLQMTKLKQSWEQKYSRLLSENKILTDNIEEMDTKIQWLQAENSALSRKYLEVFSMLNVKEQRVYQETQPQCSPDRDTSVLEMAVLGACRCPGVTEACPCSRIAAASRKQLVELQQELDAQRSRREEALMVADAFRIAFEQQLRKRSEQFLLLAEAKILKSHHFKDEGLNRSPLVSVSQRLRGLLPSSLGKKMPEDLLETLYKLLDLLNDREEALAHQRKVSIMLAHSAEELQRQLHLDAHCQLPDQSESRIKSKQTVDTPVNHSQTQQTPDASESETTEVLPKIQAQPTYELPDSQLQLSQHQNSNKPEIQQSDQSLS